MTNGKGTKLLRAMDAMRKPCSRLIQTNHRGGPDFWITPSGPYVEPDVAKRIIAHPQVIGGKDALFPGHHQTLPAAISFQAASSPERILHELWENPTAGS